MLPPRRVPRLIRNVTTVNRLNGYSTILSNCLNDTTRKQTVLANITQVGSIGPGTLCLYSPIVNRPRGNYDIPTRIDSFLLRRTTTITSFVYPGRLRLSDFSKHGPRSLFSYLTVTQTLLAHNPGTILIGRLSCPNGPTSIFRVLLIATRND